MKTIRRAFPFFLAFTVAAPLAAQIPRTPPLTYGTSVTSYVHVPGKVFLLNGTGCDYPIAAIRYSNNCPGPVFVAPVSLPSGAKVVSLELDFFDSNASNYVVGTLVTCDFYGNNCTYHPAAGAGPPDCPLGGPGYICSGNVFGGGFGFQSADLTPDNVVVDNYNGSTFLFGGSTSTDGSTGIAGMIVGYQLQVSPPPATASFNDVPTSHPFFQYIEALKAAGITGGCQVSPPLYCPDNPLTRGQMAVFLAKALGLQFP